MHVAMVITRGDFAGGAQVHVRDLVESLLPRGHHVDVLVGTPGEFGEQLQVLGARVHEVDALVHPLHPVADLGAFFQLRTILGELKPDLVAAHSSKAGLLTRLVAASLRLPNVFTAHGWSFTEGVSPTRRHVFRWLEALTIPLVNRVICVSDYDRKLAIASRVGRRDQLVTVHNGVPEVRVERSHPPQIQPVRLVMVARLGDPKQQELVIQALQGLPGGVALDLIGEGPREEVLRLVAERHGVSERVRFLGRREDVAMCLAEADIFVLMSRYEAFPLSILEAMRAGLPVVASDVGGVSEAVVEGETGFLIPRGNGSSLQDRLRTLVEQPELRRRMGSAGRARFLAGFTRERMVERTLEVYEQALAMERGRS